ncbi:MAG TPA: N-acetylmuramoyl-L-alanine amidase [Vicinamibacterales bacterium]|nr:N-acetylmuramoyl-L-alanine amidase [Vicinamibacterales bacterium]
MHVRSPLFFLVTVTAASVLLGLAVDLSSQTPASALTLVSRETRRNIPITSVGDQELVPLDDLAQALQLQLQESLGTMTISYKGKTVFLTADQPLAQVTGRMVSLSSPPTRRAARWYVPLDFASRAVGPIYDVRVDLRRAAHMLVIGDLRVPRVAVRYDPLGGAGRLTIESTPQTPSTVTQDRDRLVITFDADGIEPPNPPYRAAGAQAADSLVQAVRLSDPTTLVVDLGRRFASYKAADGDPLVIDIAGIVATPATPTTLTPSTTPTIPTTSAPSPRPAPPAAPPIELSPLLAATTAAVRTVAIDPGHGGEDEGAHAFGVDGTKEKDITLAVARRLKTMIEGRLGVRVLLTREDDRAVALDRRTALANNNKADLFISIHANASLRRSLSGATIYSAAFATAAARDAATEGSERVPTFAGGLRDIQLVPWDLAQTHHLDQSTMFAGMLLQQLTDRVPLAQTPVETAPLRVLASANMPAVLVEMGYLTNPEQDRLITSDAFQSSFAQGVFDAVVKFRDAIAAGITR